MKTPASKRLAPVGRAPLRIPALAARVLDGFRESAGMLADAISPQAPEPALRRIVLQQRRDRRTWPR